MSRNQRISGKGFSELNCLFLTYPNQGDSTPCIQTYAHTHTRPPRVPGMGKKPRRIPPCSLCGIDGDGSHGEGRIIQVTKGRSPSSVHEYCARFSPQVTLKEGRLNGVTKEIKRGKQIVRRTVGSKVVRVCAGGGVPGNDFRLRVEGGGRRRPGRPAPHCKAVHDRYISLSPSPPLYLPPLTRGRTFLPRTLLALSL